MTTKEQVLLNMPWLLTNSNTLDTSFKMSQKRSYTWIHCQKFRIERGKCILLLYLSWESMLEWSRRTFYFHL